MRSLTGDLSQRDDHIAKLQKEKRALEELQQVKALKNACTQKPNILMSVIVTSVYILTFYSENSGGSPNRRRQSEPSQQNQQQAQRPSQ